MNNPIFKYFDIFISDWFDQNWNVSSIDKKLRKLSAVRYGYYTLAISVVFLLILPKWDKITNKVYFTTLKFFRITKAPKFDSSILRINPISAQVIVIWSIILTVLTCAQTQNFNLQFIAARLGRVPVYCLPTVLFLTLRPSPLPDTLYLLLIPIHKWMARLIIFQGLMHSLLYIIADFKYDKVDKLTHVDNLNGFLALFGFIVILFSSLSNIRRQFFNFFYINHYIWTWIIVISLHFHARPKIPLITFLNCSILIYQIYYKFSISRISWINCYKISNNMTIVEIPNDSIKNKSQFPGCHIRLIDYEEKNIFKKFWKYLIAPIQHPYTIATLPCDESQKLIIKTSKFELNSNKKYIITGSYLPHLKFIKKDIFSSSLNSLSFKTNVKKCLIVAGGSAISFALPIARTLNYNGAMVKILWVIRGHEDLKILEYFKKNILSDDMIDIFITGKYSDSEKNTFLEIVQDLRKRRKEKEFWRENKMLNGDYSNATTIQHKIDVSDLNKVSTCTYSVPSTTESTPLNYNGTLQKVYGSLDSEHSKEGLFNNNNNNNNNFNVNINNNKASHLKKRGSIVNLKEHLNSKDDNREETLDVDVELDVSDRYRNSMRHSTIFKSTDSPGIGYSDEGLPSVPPILSPQLSQNSHLTDDSDSLLQNSDQISSGELTENLAEYWILENTGCQISFGRPKLGIYYYSWCIGSSCIGPQMDLRSGESICFNQTEDPNFQSQELYANETFIENRRARFQERNGKPDKTIWVVGSGPSGLVNNTRIWANDCGFKFHEESFSV